MRTLVIGGARSGKSRAAERLLADATDVIYVATAYPPEDDAEWAERVSRHRARRPASWTTLETTDLGRLLTDEGGPLLIDCLTLWLTRLMDKVDAWDDQAWTGGGAEQLRRETDALVTALTDTARDVVLVTNEVGQGVVPATAAGRRFRDEMGLLNTTVAEVCDDVLWCVAGRMVRL